MPEKKLIALDEFNMSHVGSFKTTDVPNGIECPNCKNELVDTNTTVVLTSYPAQMHIRCLNCDYTGYRYC